MHEKENLGLVLNVVRETRGTSIPGLNTTFPFGSGEIFECCKQRAPDPESAHNTYFAIIPATKKDLVGPWVTRNLALSDTPGGTLPVFFKKTGPFILAFGIVVFQPFSKEPHSSYNC